MNILVVEDDMVIGKAVQQGITEKGHACNWVQNGLAGLDLGMSQRFDVIVLDMLIPGISGLDVLTKLRAQGIRTPVVILTALGSVEDRVIGLQAGADDYLVKPFAFVELWARIEAVCRRVGTKPSMHLQVGELLLDLATRRVNFATADIDLTPTEFSLLEMLMRHAGEVVTRKMLCESLWESDWEGTTNVIEVHVNRLRGKLQKASKEPIIHTVRGRGYALRGA